MDVPASVELLADGFEVEISGRRAEERAVGALVAMSFAAMAIAVGVGRPTGSSSEILGLGVWLLIAVLAVLAMQLAWLLVAPVRTTRIRVSGFRLQLGGRRFAIGDVRGVHLRHGHLVVDAGARHVVPASHSSLRVRRWVRDHIRKRVEQWRARDGSAPPELQALRR